MNIYEEQHLEQKLDEITNQIGNLLFEIILVNVKQVSRENNIKLFSHNQRINELLQQSNIRKDKGVSLDILFQFLMRIAFTGKNLFRLVDSSATPPGIGKDVVYRFFNSVSSNWRKFLLLLSTRVIVQELLPLTDDSTTKVLIADDTLYRRDRSKKVELLARVHDHNTNSYHRGFRMLTLGWSDGNSFIPMLFSMLSSAKEKNRLAPMRSDIDKRTNDCAQSSRRPDQGDGGRR